jgi:hypothetical protein
MFTTNCLLQLAASTELISVVSYLLYTARSQPHRNNGLIIVEAFLSWLPCNHVLLLEGPAYPWKCLTCGCLATTTTVQTRHNILEPPLARHLCCCSNIVSDAKQTKSGEWVGGGRESCCFLLKKISDEK